jgi:hypothetical protein
MNNAPTSILFHLSVSGVAGFFKGVGKGILGVAVRPTVGVFDMVSRMFVGIRNTAAMLGTNAQLVHVRLPRMLVGETRTLQVFNPQLAFVQEVLFRLWGPTRVRSLSAVLGYLAVADRAELLVITPNCVTCVDLEQYAQAQQAAAGKSSTSTAAGGVASGTTGGSKAEWDARPELVWEIDTRGIIEVRVNAKREPPPTATAAATASKPKTRTAAAEAGNVTVILSTERAVKADRSKVKLVTSSQEGGKCVLTIPAHSLDVIRAISTSLEIAGQGQVFREKHAVRRRKLLGLVMQPVPTLVNSQRTLNRPSKPTTSLEAARQNGVFASLHGPATHPDLPDSGVGLVERVDVGSVAHEAGMKPGDCLVGFGGSVLDYGDYGSSLYRAVELLPPGAALEVIVWRQGRWLRFELVFPHVDDDEEN